MYNDNYETCSETYVTLRIYSNTKNPNELTKYLGIEPSEIQVKTQKNTLIELNGWFYLVRGK